MPYVYAAAICITIINDGAPGWLYLKDRINVGLGDAVLTESMLDLRRSPFS